MFFLLAGGAQIELCRSSSESRWNLGNKRLRRWWFYFSLLPPSLAEYQGTFQSCFHFGDAYRMEPAAVDGVNVPADPQQAYGQHQQNGFHASGAAASGLAGATVQWEAWMEVGHRCDCSRFVPCRLQLDAGAAAGGGLPVLIQP